MQTESRGDTISLPHLALIGPMRCGKDTAGTHLVLKHGYSRFAFADALKQELAKVLTSQGHCVDAEGIDRNKDRYRQGLQWWATEIRRRDDPEYWIRKVEKTLSLFQHNVPLVCTDARFLNEIDFLRKRNFIIVRISIEEDNTDKHISEQEWRSVTPDEIIVNDIGNVDFLYTQLDDLVERGSLGLQSPPAPTLRRA